MIVSRVAGIEPSRASGLGIPKADGRQRPLGIAALEDKIVQQALVGVLQEVYEEDFLGFSYGFRLGRNQHMTLDAIYVAITQPETFDFLGFTHICAKRKANGGFALRHKSIAKRLRAKLKEVRETLMRCRHRPVPEQGGWLRSVVQEHFNYFGVPGNRKTLDTFRTQIGHAWISALRRRSQKAISLTCKRFQRWMKLDSNGASCPSVPNQRLCV